MDPGIGVIVALFAVLVWIRLEAAITLLVAFLPTYLLRFSIFGLPTNFFEVATAIVFLATVMRRPFIRLPKSSLFFTGLFVLSTIVATAISHEPRVSLGILKGWVIIPLLFSYVALQLPTHKLLRQLVISGLVVGLIGLLQIGQLSRLQSIYDVPASLALFIAPLLIISIWQRYPLPISLILAVALVGTQSVSGIGAVIIALGFGAYLWRRKLLLSLTIFIILATTYLGFTGKIAYLLQPLSNPATHTSWSVRQQLWSVSLELIKQHPLLGIGLGQFEPAYQKQLAHMTNIIPEFVIRDPHNWLLSFWLNTGLLGLMSFITLHIIAFKSSKHQAICLALLTLLIFGLTDTIYWKNDLAALHWVLLAVTVNGFVGVDGRLLEVRRELGGDGIQDKKSAEG